MTYVTDANFDTVFPQSARDEYWRRVKFALRHYFNEEETIADNLRQSIEAASVGEQLLLYHDDSLATASKLADRAIEQSVAEDFARHFNDDPIP